MNDYKSQPPAMSPRNIHGYGDMRDFNKLDVYNYEKVDLVMSDSYKYDSLDKMPLAMAYVPWQKWRNVYDLNMALEVGTIFPELNLPFCGRRGERE
ncbi:spore coat associated protein CotJA [Cellulosilyticum sp. I15G10I2]|uniref:spore coat associated protein CotJA n=1 Tax=Cellulosilyticum sp. I15G10I2 TaxID=1892843 RepID=UPI00085C9D4E|nr:spore coat associated protein CotJA [Cellulosilyticum sp. I15G10I2]